MNRIQISRTIWDIVSGESVEDKAALDSRILAPLSNLISAIDAEPAEALRLAALAIEDAKELKKFLVERQGAKARPCSKHDLEESRYYEQGESPKSYK